MPTPLDPCLLDLGGTYRVPEAGDPIQYGELRTEHDQGDVEIVVYNRAVLLFTTDQRGGEAHSSSVLPAGGHRRVTPPGVPFCCPASGPPGWWQPLLA